MKITRRRLLTSLLVLGGARALQGPLRAAPHSVFTPTPVRPEALVQAAAAPVLRLDEFRDPVRIASIELLRVQYEGNHFLVRVRSQDGAEGVSVTNAQAAYLGPIFSQRVAPYFVGKDARDLEALIDGVYRHASNYKMQSLALWCPLAWIEFAILDMLGRIAGKPVSELFGGRVRDLVPMYYASGNRQNSAREEADVLARAVAETGCRAVKFKVGGRMSNDADSIPGRTEALIPLVREVLGPDIVIQADANGSYNPRRAIEVGRMLEEIGAYLYEEPCPFDHLDETKEVADALRINVAGGEQESSERRFRWMIEHDAVQIVQPDLHYYGGMIRATRVARMAALAKIPTTLHLSGGLGYSQMLHFCSFTPDIGLFQEYKGDVRRTGPWFDPPIVFRNGALNVPTAPGFGMVAADELVKRASKIG